MLVFVYFYTYLVFHSSIKKMGKLFITLASISGTIGVIIGAFGAHKLASFLEKTNHLSTYETAVKYQFYHSIALLLTGIIITIAKNGNNHLNYAGYSFIIGIVLFSGSLYAICFSGISKLGIITPFGGLLFISGWVFLALGSYKGI